MNYNQMNEMFEQRFGDLINEMSIEDGLKELQKKLTMLKAKTYMKGKYVFFVSNDSDIEPKISKTLESVISATKLNYGSDFVVSDGKVYGVFAQVSNEKQGKDMKQSFSEFLKKQNVNEETEVVAEETKEDEVNERSFVDELTSKISSMESEIKRLGKEGADKKTIEKMIELKNTMLETLKSIS